MPRGGYAKPPVTEAVIDVRFARPITTKELDRLQKRLSKRYPLVENQLSVNFNIGPNEAKFTQRPSGYKMSSADNLDILLLQPEGMMNSRLPPYHGWDVLLERVEANLAEVTAVAGFRGSNRIGVRYVNRIDIPGDNIVLADWLNIGVFMPEMFSRAVSNYALSTTFSVDQNTSANINSGASPPVLIEHSSFVVDIDIYTVNLVINQAAIFWEKLKAFRNIKNSFFEASITEKCRDLFRPGFGE